MPKSSRSITPKSSSKSHRQTTPAAKSAASVKPSKNGHGKSDKAESKNGHKNGKTESSVATPSKSITDTHEKDAKGVQAVWTGQPERQERLRDLVKLAKDQGYLTWDDLNEAIPESDFRWAIKPFCSKMSCRTLF